MNFAYADPPYLGQGRKMYGHPEWDSLDAHRDLVATLAFFWLDGWALSVGGFALAGLLFSRSRRHSRSADLSPAGT